MKHSCPNCGANLKLFSMKLVRTDKVGRKAGQLGVLHVCYNCEETLTRNKHWDELGLAISVVFMPFIIGYIGLIIWHFGFEVSGLIVMLIAVLVLFIACGYSYYHYKYKLVDWPRWITLTEYLDNQNTEK